MDGVCCEPLSAPIPVNKEVYEEFPKIAFDVAPSSNRYPAEYVFIYFDVQLRAQQNRNCQPGVRELISLIPRIRIPIWGTTKHWLLSVTAVKPVAVPSIHEAFQAPISKSIEDAFFEWVFAV